DATPSLARYSSKRAWTTSGARLPSCVNSVGRPSFRACHWYASARRPSASFGSIVRIQTIQRVHIVKDVHAGVQRQGGDGLQKGPRVVVSIEHDKLGPDFA